MHISGRKKSCCRYEVSLRFFLGYGFDLLYLHEKYEHDKQEFLSEQA